MIGTRGIGNGNYCSDWSENPIDQIIDDSKV